MSDLAACMHAGVGAAGALHQGFVAGERFNRRGEQALNGELIDLDLPTGKRQTVFRQIGLSPWTGAGQDPRAPAFTAVPRKTAPVDIGCLPARCTSVRRTAPVPQAIVSFSSSTTPGAPEPPPLVERSALI